MSSPSRKYHRTPPGRLVITNDREHKALFNIISEYLIPRTQELFDRCWTREETVLDRLDILNELQAILSRALYTYSPNTVLEDTTIEGKNSIVAKIDELSLLKRFVEQKNDPVYISLIGLIKNAIYEMNRLSPDF